MQKGRPGRRRGRGRGQRNGRVVVVMMMLKAGGAGCTTTGASRLGRAATAIEPFSRGRKIFLRPRFGRVLARFPVACVWCCRETCWCCRRRGQEADGVSSRLTRDFRFSRSHVPLGGREGLHSQVRRGSPAKTATKQPEGHPFAPRAGERTLRPRDPHNLRQHWRTSARGGRRAGDDGVVS